jgi:hypothetical protein
MSTNTPSSVLSTQFFSKLASGQHKEAADAATDYTRLTLRDEGIVRKIIPAETITEAQLDAQLDTDKPVKIIEKEVQQPLGVSVPFGTLPTNTYMNWSKYRVDFARILTENFVKDIQEVKTWNSDIRNIFKDNAIKDMMTSEDRPFMALVNAIVSANNAVAASATTDGTLGTFQTGNAVSSLTGKVQFYDWTQALGNPLGVTSGFTRDAIVESSKILSKAHSLANATTATPIRLKTDVVLMNVNTGKEYLKFTRDQIGGDKSGDFFEKGLTEGTFFGDKHIFTLKDDLVLDGEAYYFAAPQFLGRFFELEAPTMFMELRAYLLEFFIYSCVGMSIGNPYGVAKVKYF